MTDYTPPGNAKQLREQLADLIDTDRPDDINQWPEDEIEFHRNGKHDTPEAAAAAIVRYRQLKAADAILSWPLLEAHAAVTNAAHAAEITSLRAQLLAADRSHTRDRERLALRARETAAARADAAALRIELEAQREENADRDEWVDMPQEDRLNEIRAFIVEQLTNHDFARALPGDNGEDVVYMFVEPVPVDALAGHITDNIPYDLIAPVEMASSEQSEHERQAELEDFLRERGFIPPAPDTTMPELTCQSCGRRGTRGFTTVPDQEMTLPNGETTRLPEYTSCTATQACRSRWTRPHPAAGNQYD